MRNCTGKCSHPECICKNATVSERNAVLRERAAFVKGYHTYRDGSYRPAFGGVEEGERYAHKAFPLPRVTRPRVAQTSVGEIRVVNGIVQIREGAGWLSASVLTRANVEAIADLLANPTEEVEADA